MPIVLYALAADGSPSLRSGETDEHGRFTFERISNASAAVYLVGARYREVPFGRRVTFGVGQRELDIELEVSEPTPDTGAVEITETELRLFWMYAVRLSLRQCNGRPVNSSSTSRPSRFGPPGYGTVSKPKRHVHARSLGGVHVAVAAAFRD